METDRLILRPLVIEDCDDIQRNFPHWSVVKYLSAKKIKWPYPEDGAYKFLKNIALPAMERGEGWYWGIVTKENASEVIGVVTLRKDPEPGNRTFWIAPEHQSKGYMAEALEAVTDFAFYEAGFEKLILKNAHENVASHQLKQKTGAELLAILPTKSGHYLNAECTQQEVWQITRENWQAYKDRNLNLKNGFNAASQSNVKAIVSPMPKKKSGSRPKPG